jgi:hypothetical protein
MKRFLASLAFAFLSAALLLGQHSSSTSSGPNGMHGTMQFGPPYLGGSVITGAPYSAEEVDESLQALADGTHIRHTIPGVKTYRDSMGRTRTERQTFYGMTRKNAPVPEGPTTVEINDSVAHVRYIFVLGEPTAHRQQLPVDAPIAAQSAPTTPAQPEPAQATIGNMVAANSGGNALGTAPNEKKCPVVSPAQQAADESFPQSTTENLGTQIIEGIPAEGSRNTTTWPVDSMGNDRPIVTSNESWWSPDLKENILTKSNDPRNGENTHKLINISRSEPDSSLFGPPPGYTVKDEKDEFTLNWGTAR